MYQKPEIVRYGSFRDVTMGGPTAIAVDFSADALRDFLFHETPTTS